MRLLRWLTVLVLAAPPLAAQMPAYPRIPPANGFRVFISTDMDGMGSLVFNREQMAGTEAERSRRVSRAAAAFGETAISARPPGERSRSFFSFLSFFVFLTCLMPQGYEAPVRRT